MAQKILNGVHISGTTQLDFMPTHESEGIIKLGRYDSNTNRYHNIKSYVSSTEASNYLKFSLHNGTVNTVVDVLTLNGNKKATFTGGMQIDGKLGIGTAPTTRNLSVFRSTAGSIANFLHYTDSSTFQGLYIQVSQATDEVIFQSSGTSGGGFAFYSGNAEKATISAGGAAVFAGNIDAGAAGKLSFTGTSGSPDLIIKNNTATSNTAGTATLKFNQALTQAGGKIVSGRDSNYSDGATRDSHLKFYTSTNATDTLVLTLDSDNAATFSGSVGIGKTPSQWILDVDSADAYIGSFDGSGNTGVVLNSNNSTAAQIIGYSNSASAYNDLDIRSNSTAGSGVYIDGSTSRVGIGTTSPSAPLDVLGVRAGRSWAINNRANIRLDSNGAGNPSDILFGHTAAANETSWTGVYWALSSRGSSDGNKFHFYRGSGNPGGNEAIAMTIASDLKVGIGTTSPSTFLQVSGQGNRAGGNIQMGLSSQGADKWSYLTGTHYNSTTEPEGFALIGGYSDIDENRVVIGGDIWETNPATSIHFWTHGSSTHAQGGTQKMVINSSGKVGIGQTLPTHTLHVKNSTGDVRGIMIEQAVSASYAELAIKSDLREFRLGTGGNGTNNANAENLFYIYDATTGGAAGHRFEINSNGDVQARRPRSNTDGEVALSLQPTDSTIHYGFRIDQTNNTFNLDRVDSALNLLNITTAGNAGFCRSRIRSFRKII